MLTESQQATPERVPRNVLIVDDDADFAASLVAVLEPRGYRLASAHNAEEARRAARKFDARVALLDIRLGRNDGLSLIGKLKKLRPGILCVMMTAYAELDSAVEAMQSGAYDYLRKPLDPAVLFSSLDRCFSRLDLEREKAQTQKELRESEQRYRILADLAPVGIFHADAAGSCLYVNERWSHMTGLCPEEAHGKTWDHVVHPEDRERVARDWRVAMKQGCPFRAEYRHRRPDGSVLWVYGQAVACTDAAGDITGYIGTVTDVTERRQAEEEREHLEAQLRQAQKMEAMGELAAGVAHDLNNVLTAIIGYTYTARSASQEHPKVIEALDEISKASDQAEAITRSLLTFSRKARAEKVPVHLGALVDKSVRMLRSILPAAIEINADAPVKAPDLWISADATQIQQVIINLAVNARDAMPDGGKLHVSVRHRPVNSSNVLSAVVTKGKGAAVAVIEDTGCGMPQEVLNRVFEPFFTTKARGKGTGLGMAVVHGIISRHQGHIEVTSEPGRGTRVTLTFPCISPPGVRATAAKEEPMARGHGETVLLAEDNEQLRSLTRSSLESVGYKVVVTGDGVEALAEFEAHAPDVNLAMLDLDLPKKDGLSCLREMRNTRPDMPVLLITGNIDPSLDERIDKHTWILRKPFGMNELASVTAELLAASGRKPDAS